MLMHKTYKQTIYKRKTVWFSFQHYKIHMEYLHREIIPISHRVYENYVLCVLIGLISDK